MPNVNPDTVAYLAQNPLNGEQVRALRSIQHRHGVPDHHASALVSLRYAEPGLGGLMLTELGRARLAMEHRRG